MEWEQLVPDQMPKFREVVLSKPKMLSNQWRGSQNRPHRVYGSSKHPAPDPEAL